MTKSRFYFLFPLLLTALLAIAFSSSLFEHAPFGSLLEPFKGAIRANLESELNHDVLTTDLGLKDSVQIFFDNRKVPHIFAKNNEDLFFAQGYLSASLRLFQMDMISRRAAGRLSEWSDRGLSFDRYQRRLGIPGAAEKSLALIEQDTATLNVLSAYARGVNAYISQLTPKTTPIEYKIIGKSVEEWSNLKTVLIQKFMASTLTKYEEDITMTNLMLILGESDFNMLYPDFPKKMSPIITGNEDGAQNNRIVKKPEYLDRSYLTPDQSSTEKTGTTLGSNGWAVSGKLTKSGNPILCADPHLELTMPAIWLEMQLSSPSMNVYGVSIPGVPAITIGYNEHIAWSTTNGSDDVKDWYKLEVNKDFTKYKLDGEWVDFRKEVVEIKTRGVKSFYDTIYHTAQGPVVITKEFADQSPHLLNLALKWELHQPSNEFKTFINLNKAKNYEDYQEAISHYKCPIQNFIFAGKNNDIAINHQGNLPVKNHGQGRFVLDGASKDLIYDSYIPTDSLPRLFNPNTNFVFSANQHPTDSKYRYYYNGYFVSTRANQIKSLLDSTKNLDVQRMMKIQMDNINPFSVDALPVLLTEIRKHELTKDQAILVDSLSKWNCSYDVNDKYAWFFESWWRSIEALTWDELDGYSFKKRNPDNYVLLDLISRDPNNTYFNNKNHSELRSAGAIISKTFSKSFEDYSKLDNNTWGNFHQISFIHYTKFVAFSRLGIPVSGHPNAINSISESVGPSWRMIVELGEWPQGYGIYPGGSSGSVSSTYYDSQLNDWAAGKYYPLSFYKNWQEALAKKTTQWKLK